VEGPTITKSKKGAAGLEFNKELIASSDVKGIVQCEFVPPDTTANPDFNCDVFRRLKENVR
jgi:hypothetical protein